MGLLQDKLAKYDIPQKFMAEGMTEDAAQRAAEKAENCMDPLLPI